MQDGILISVIIPCRNEELYIEKCIQSLLAQTGIEQNKIEIIIVDGESTDSTKEILDKYAGTNVRIISNPRLITPVAMNLGIKAATGDYIAILGAHSTYPPDYLSNSLKLFKIDKSILGVGGPIFSEGSNNFSKATALCMSSAVGVGNAKHRFPDYEGFAEMACFPVFHKSAFEKAGFYDEKLIRNQDDEFCFRLRRLGYKIYISPRVQATYYVRTGPMKLFSQYFNYGYWRVAVLRKHKIPISIRQLIPGLFFLIVFIFLVIGFMFRNITLGAALPAIYIGSTLIFAFISIKKIGIKSAVNIPFVLFILHFSYALGFYRGFFNLIRPDRN